MHTLRLIIFLAILFLQFGCSQKVPQPVELDTIIDDSIEETSGIMVQKENKIQELVEQIEKLEYENNEHIMRIYNLENEKRQFTIADRFGRKLYQAMVFSDVEVLQELTKTSDLQVFNDRFELLVGDELIQIPFSHLQTDVHLNNQVILKTNGFGFDDDLQVMSIHYTVIEPENAEKFRLSSEYFLNVNLMKVNTLEWTVINVEFDI